IPAAIANKAATVRVTSQIAPARRLQHPPSPLRAGRRGGLRPTRGRRSARQSRGPPWQQVPARSANAGLRRSGIQTTRAPAEPAEGRATAGMRFGDRRTGAVQKLLESAAAQVAEQHPRRLVRKLRMLALHLGENASSYPKEIWQAVVIQVGDAVPPTDVPGLDTQ